MHEERCMEQPGVIEGERQISGTYGSQLRGGDSDRVTVGDQGHSEVDRARELGERGIADRGEEGAPISEVAVGGIGRDTDPPGCFAQHDGIGAAAASEFDSGGEKGLPEIAMMVALARNGCDGDDRRLSCWTVSAFYDSVHGVHISSAVWEIQHVRRFPGFQRFLRR